MKYIFFLRKNLLKKVSVVGGFFAIGATYRTRREIQCFPYVIFLEVLSWLTSLLCIERELAGVWSVAVALGVGDR